MIRNRCLILKHRGVLCTQISDGYEPRTSLADIKDDSKSRRNQQVYSASPVKATDKCSESGIVYVPLLFVLKLFFM